MPNRLSLGIGGIALALSLAAASPIRAGQDSAVTALENGPPNLAACAVQAAPHCGDMAAQYRLGLMLKDGLGVPKDSLAALGWFLCAARSDGQIGIDATRWAEQLSSSLSGPAVLAARKNPRGCRRLADIAPRLETSEASEPPETGKGSFWENLGVKLDRFTETLSSFETASPDGGAPAERTAAEQTAAPKQPRFSTQAAVAVPERRSVWSRAYFLPADGTIIGSQHIAWKLGADNFLRDMRDIAQDSDDLTLGLFAAFWWVLIGKSVLSVGRAILGPYRRSGTRRFGQGGLIAPRR